MNEPIRTVIETYVQGGAIRNVDQVASVLSPEFRVIANRFRNTVGTTIISREAYLKQLSDGKIGGSAYQLDWVSIAVYEHTAQAEVWYRGEKSDMHNFFWLIQDEHNQWLLVSIMAVVVSK